MPLVSTFGNLSARAFGLGAYRAATAFTPLSLFSAGEQGVWYDPSDLSTMFENSTGLTQVHTPGNGTADSPVGMILDKHVTLGSELITNGDFSNGTTGWSIYQQAGTGTLTASGGVATLTNAAGATYGTAYQAIPTTVGAWYKVSGVIGPSTGVAYSALRKSDDTPPTSQLVAFYSLNNGLVPANTNVLGMFQATATTSYISIQTNGGGNSIQFKNISVKAASGNHATQSTTTARPTLSARYNLLTYSEQFNNAAWGKTNISVSADAATAPDNTLTADMISETASNGSHGLYQAATVVSGIGYTSSVALKAGTARYAVLSFATGSTQAVRYSAVVDLQTGTITQNNTLNSPTGTSSSIVSLGSGWYRVTIAQTTSSTSSYLVVAMSNTATPTSFATNTLDPSYTGSTSNNLYIWGADLRPTNDGTGLPTYQRIADANTYDSTGFPYYLKFDGVDDNLSGNDSFMPTGDASLFSGSMALVNFSSGSYGTVVIYGKTLTAGAALGIAYGNDANVSNGIFVTPSGNGLGFANTTLTRIVFTAQRIGTSYSIRSQGGANTGSKTMSASTQLYGSGGLTLGRNGSGSNNQPLNGRAYGIIIRGASSTSTEIANTETWLNTKTKAY